MKNLASDIIDLLNFIRPANNIIKEIKYLHKNKII